MAATPPAKEEPPAEASQAVEAISEKTKQQTIRVLTFGIFQAVLQHVLALQSDVTLFVQAASGDQVATAAALSSSTAIAGVVGLFLNQIGGKLSDTVGRKPCFLMGPLFTMLSAALLSTRRAPSLAFLVLMRVIRSSAITFAGTVMCQASLMDVCTPADQVALGPKIQVAVGTAVVLGPYIESFILKASNNNPVRPFQAMFVASLFQLCNNYIKLPETLLPSKRVDLASFTKSISSINPFSFVKVYLADNQRLKKLMSILTFQFCTDGKVTSDLFQLWSRDNLKWTAEQRRDFVAFWGGTVTAGAYFVHPRLLKRLSTRTYTTIANLFVGAGLTLHGVAEHGACMWGGVPLLIPGVNGGSCHAIKALANTIASKEGYGNGEFSAWTNNVRALSQTLQILFLGRWYASCGQKKWYQGSTWWLAGFVGGFLPQLIMLTMPLSDFAMPEEATPTDTGKDKGTENGSSKSH